MLYRYLPVETLIEVAHPLELGRTGQRRLRVSGPTCRRLSLLPSMRPELYEWTITITAWCWRWRWRLMHGRCFRFLTTASSPNPRLKQQEIGRTEYVHIRVVPEVPVPGKSVLFWDPVPGNRISRSSGFGFGFLSRFERRLVLIWLIHMRGIFIQFIWVPKIAEILAL